MVAKRSTYSDWGIKERFVSCPAWCREREVGLQGIELSRPARKTSKGPTELDKKTLTVRMHW